MNSNATLFQKEFLQLIVENIREETKDFKTIFFREGHGLHYEAGQFITLIDRTGPEEIRRSYSIISSPILNEPLAIGVKRMPNGFFSRRLTDYLAPGDKLTCSGISGFFKLPENVMALKTIFFFAAGSGISPIISLIKTVLVLHPGITVFLLYSNTSRESTAYYRELEQLEQQFGERLFIRFLFSNMADLLHARLNTEFLADFLKTKAAEKEKTMFYVCGPESYMRMVIFLLLEEGYPREYIRKEDFNPTNRKLTLPMPPEKNNWVVELKMGNEKFSFTVIYPETILQAARRNKLNIPYSCETGKCGTCAAHRISGKIWLSNNEVLTEEDLSKGLVLTCTGYPQSGDVFLQLD